jgi:hypothetical protein
MRCLGTAGTGCAASPLEGFTASAEASTTTLESGCGCGGCADELFGASAGAELAIRANVAVTTRRMRMTFSVISPEN